MSKEQQKEKGLTLVEIAIAVVIIGLLTTGILKGGQVITNAKVVGLINTIKSVEGAIISFEDFYGFKPGDVAPTKVPGCTAANSCTLASTAVESGSVNDDPGPRGWVTKFSATRNIENESFLFWKHLALAGMISDIDTSVAPANVGWGESHPGTPFGGGLEFYEDLATTVGYSGEILRISSDGIFPGGGATGALNPLITRKIDSKLDDEDPNNGLVFADYGVNGNACKNHLGGGISEYRNDRDAVCILFIGF